MPCAHMFSVRDETIPCRARGCSAHDHVVVELCASDVRRERWCCPSHAVALGDLWVGCLFWCSLEYFGELLLAFELELRPKAPPAPQEEPTVMQLCYLDYLQYAEDNAERHDVFQAYEFATDPNLASPTPWCRVHALSDVITRVAIAPLMTWEERDFDETRLYHNTDMYVHI